MKRFGYFPLLILFLLLREGAIGQLSVTPGSALGLTPTQLVQNWLVGQGITVTNATINGSSAVISSDMIGTFIAFGDAQTQLGIDSGILVTSGNSTMALGPNINCGIGQDMFDVGDPDLTILADTITYDRCVLQFDFIPFADTIHFSYVFGSEELYNYCYLYNDAFGFFLSGPGITGPFSNNSVDIALMPNSTNYVTINSICSDTTSAWCNSTMNCGNNSLCINAPPNCGAYFEYNALTHVFSAWHAVQPCQVYHIKIAVADALDHILDSGVFLDQGSFSSGSITGPTPVCADTIVKVYSTQAGKSDYIWNVSPGGTIIAGGTTTDNTITIRWETTGVDTISVIYTNSGGCNPPSPFFLLVTVLPLPQPVVSGPTDACIDSTGYIYTTATGMTNYAWTVSLGGLIIGGGTSSSDSAKIRWIATGIQSVSVNYADSNSCIDTVPGVLNVTVTAPQPTLTGPGAACEHTTDNLYTTEPGMNGYLWNISPGGDITSGLGTDSILVTWNTPGTQFLSISYKDQNGCQPASPTILDVSVEEMPDRAGTIKGPSVVCIGQGVVLFSVAPIAHATGYTWNLPPGFVILSGGGTDSITVYTVQNVTPGVISVFGTNACGAGEISPLFIVMLALAASAEAGPDGLICAGIPYTLSQTSASNYSRIRWFTSGDGTFDDPQSLHPIYSPGSSDALSGFAMLTLVAFSDPPCNPDSDSMVLSISKPAVISAGTDTAICNGRKLRTTNASARNYNAVHWITTGDGTFTDPDSLKTFYVPGNGDQIQGHVILILTASGIDPCPPATDTMMLILEPGPRVIPGPDGTICGGMSYTVTGVTSDHVSVFHWVHDGLGVLIDTVTLSPTYLPGSGETGTVHLVLQASGLLGCADSAVTCSINVVIYPAPIVTAGEDLLIKFDSIVLLTCEPSMGSGLFSYRWMPESLLLNDTLQNPQTINLTVDTVFIVRVSDLLTGCKASDTIRVRVVRGEGPSECIVIHNVITPNGDGLNDHWVIDCIELYPGNSVQIFNRWGDRIRSYQNYDNTTTSWEGTDSEGRPLPDGTYFYVLRIPGVLTLNGWVYLRNGRK